MRRPAAKKARISITSDLHNDIDDTDILHRVTTIKTVGDIWHAFEWNRGTRKSLPGEGKRKTNTTLREEGSPGWSSMVQTVLSAAVQLSELVYSASSMALLEDVARAVLDISSDPRDERKRLVDALSNISDRAPRRSVQGRVARAVLTKGLSKNSITQLKGKGALRLGGRSIDNGYKEYFHMISGKELCKAAISATRFNEQAVENAVKVMLHPSNVGKLSWGHKKITLTEHEVVTLPVLRRRRAQRDIFEDYLAYSTDLGVPRISRGSFYKVIAVVTSGEERIMSALDYVTGVLLNDQVGVLQRIGDDFAVTAGKAKRLTDFLELMRNFLRQQYDAHASNDAYSDHTHGILYGLEKPDPSEPERVQHCNASNFVAFSFEELRTCIKNSEHRPDEIMQDALNVFGDIESKMELYRAHCVRVANQQSAIQSLHQDLEDKCKRGEATNHAIVVMD